MWRRVENEVPEEHESFRAGCYADHLVAAKQEVPPWAWLNALAQGSEVLVASLAVAQPGPRGAPPELHRWYVTRKALAAEVMRTLTAEGCSLVELQHDVLRGLELELAAAASWAAPPEPQEVTGMVLEALHAFGGHRRR